MFEISLYRLAPGVDAPELARRCAHEAAALFGREASPPRLGGVWYALSGIDLPMVCMLTHWRDLAQRDRVFPVLGDQLSGTESACRVRACDTWLLTPNAAWSQQRPPARARSPHGVDELRILPVLCPSVPEATRSLETVDLPLFRSLGAEVVAVLDAAIGADMPAIVLILAWPDLETQQRGADRVDVDPRVWRQRDRETATLGRPLFGPVQQYLLRAAEGGQPAGLNEAAKEQAVGWWGAPVAKPENQS